MARFQQRHGLIADALPGRNTVRALNVPVDVRIQQLVANLERARIRAVPADPYIVVNIPEYRLRLVSGGQTIFDTPVITGRPSRPTPLIASSISSVVLNPTWTVPIKLAGADIVPKVLKDPEYLGKEGIRIFSSFSHDDVEIDPDTIDWQTIDRKRFPYRLRQDPGPLNSLGRVKLNFPNTHDVYMHDTPDRHLLERDERAFSSGCIRVMNPVDLAEKVMASQPGWDRARIDAIIAAGAMVTLSVPRNISVRLVYDTAWVAGDGIVNFRQDIYGHDAELTQTMGSHPRLAQSTP
jgi:murein L,D-transpeptidase YcbB/YkuD